MNTEQRYVVHEFGGGSGSISGIASIFERLQGGNRSWSFSWRRMKLNLTSAELGLKVSNWDTNQVRRSRWTQRMKGYVGLDVGYGLALINTIVANELGY